MSGAATASMDSKATDKKAKKFFLPQPAVDLREALYANGRQPSDSEKRAVYEMIVKMEGCESYARKTHSNFCTHIERKRKTGFRDYVVAWLQQVPNPSLADVLLWSRVLQVSPSVVFEIIMAEVPRGVTEFVEHQHALSLCNTMNPSV
ncbi:hypothetical protein BD309DRAFT_992549 [Dichomitus squalens]|uniref:Uncharacterized protein n=2 Tax=Dichomitus squalens TaxID=114155 RepID=A0A4Q9PPS7_9APHY|nr:uncharacterized protein DICSQDRAFT_181172 [Dichomitus squalens LYAD-421 SS1]EJF60669.1 hypothetical protein DICSQDRAFT_181172 [Dichomitus squalens LYAD-421 SS1]TBU41218.1 hypothetical protein BD309DRAFT_992549 [Dichomitus squalens]TBU56327.1 hypothetical protein BD310DRAFT_950186 [Dichomitus squalens]